jgi:glycosyltransferase involved in cell wall biosynthesis
MSDTSTTYPRLAYVGDVPVEFSYHGSALLARLLEDYPAAQLRICEFGAMPSRPDRRLVNVIYQRASPPFLRWLNTRFHRWVSSACSMFAPLRANEITRTLAGFEPEVIVTVAHGYSWIAAYAFAKKNRLPLVLIVHDDWPKLSGHVGWVANWVDRTFADAYRYAHARLCVSPYMVAAYAARYGAQGDVLYPSRARSALSFKEPPDAGNRETGLTVVFAGTINTQGYVDLLRRLATALASVSGRLLLFGPLTVEQAEQVQLNGVNIEIRGLVSSNELIERCRSEADVLYVPMSFEASDEANMRISFPSKLTDYTAIGLPLMLQGPHYSSAIVWALTNPGVAEVVTSPDLVSIEACIVRLAGDAELRATLARRAISVGNAHFSHEVAFDIFKTAVRSAHIHSAHLAA